MHRNAGAHTMQAAWAGVQEAAERAVVRVMAGQAAALLSQARAAPWLPELPPRATAPASPYVSEILTFLEVPCFALFEKDVQG